MTSRAFVAIACIVLLVACSGRGAARDAPEDTVDEEAEAGCTTDEDCDDDCVCTDDDCVTETGLCEYSVICNMCSHDTDCFDGTPCMIPHCVPWDCGMCPYCTECTWEPDPECG